jgi:hypothetical protein
VTWARDRGSGAATVFHALNEGSHGADAQLLGLGELIGDEELVSGARDAWHGLSRACRHQMCELPRTDAELGTWLNAVDRLVAYDPTRS